MKKKISVLLVLCFIISSFSFSATATSVNLTNESSASLSSFDNNKRLYVSSSGEQRIIDNKGYVINQLIVNTNTLIDLSIYNNGNVNSFYGVNITKIKELFIHDLVDEFTKKAGNIFPYLITLSDSENIENAISTLSGRKNIISVEQNYVSESGPCSSYDAQTASTQHYDLIGVETVWNKGFVGSDNVVVAVLDTGAISHSEFDNNMAYSLGYNAVDDNTNITPTYQSNLSHGHKVAGIIGADLGDGGVNGICQNVTMVPVKISGEYDAQALGFWYAIAIDADIINMSWGSSIPPTGETLTTITHNQDILVVVSAGNNNVDLVTMNSQKNNDEDNWIVVGNSTVNDEKSDSSNYSKTYVDIFAPGTSVKTVDLNSNVPITVSGTSFSAPMVSAAAALIMSHATHLTAAQVRSYIINNDDDVAALSELCVSGGRLAIDKIVNTLYSENRGAYSKGDITGDGQIGMADYTLLKRMYNGTYNASATQISAGDVNKNGSIDVEDYTMVQQYYYQTYYFPPV